MRVCVCVCVCAVRVSSLIIGRLPLIVAARDGASGEDRYDPRPGGGRRRGRHWTSLQPRRDLAGGCDLRQRDVSRRDQVVDGCSPGVLAQQGKSSRIFVRLSRTTSLAPAFFNHLSLENRK